MPLTDQGRPLSRGESHPDNYPDGSQPQPSAAAGQNRPYQQVDADPTPVVMCRVVWCRRELFPSTYSFGDGLGNAYRKCGGGHWTPEPPPPDLAAIDDADAYDGEGFAW